MGRNLSRLACAVGLALIAGCSSAGSRPTSEPSSNDARPTHALPDNGWRSGDAALLAAPRGEFHATLTPRGACAWMGKRSVPFSYSWPTGYRVRFNPTELLDPSGHVVATDGQVIESAGGFNAQTPGGRGKPTRPTFHTWCGRPGEPVLAVQGQVHRTG